MFTDNEEAGYLQRRVDVSLGMARAAAGDCARMAHEALAAGYGRRLAALTRIPQSRQSLAPPEAAGKVAMLRATDRTPDLLVEA